MGTASISPEAISAQKQVMVRQEIGVRVFKMALEAEASSALQLIQAMSQSAGLGTTIDTVV
jgi:hypothetical protein